MPELMILGGPRDREIVRVADDRWAWQMYEVTHADPVSTGPRGRVALDVHTYHVHKVGPGAAMMLPAGVTHWRVLIPGWFDEAGVAALLARDERPVVDGQRR